MTIQFDPIDTLDLSGRGTGWVITQLLHDLEHGFAGHLDQLTVHAATDLFRNRIDSSQSRHAWWDAETRGNWLWGFVMMAHLTGASQHKNRAARLMQELLDTADEDGYIGIYSPEWRYQHPPGENGELWAQGRALLALLTHAINTGAEPILHAVEKAAGLTMQHYGPHNSYFKQPDDPHHTLTGLTHGLTYVDVMAELYRITNHTSYRDWGVWLYDDFCQMTIPFDNDDLAMANLQHPQRQFRGHAVHTAEHLRVVLWCAAVTAREDLQQAADNALDKLKRYLLPGGALIGYESIHGIPTTDSGYEYCTLTELLLSLGMGLRITGNVWFADVMEQLAYNAGQGARLPDGTAISYLSSDTRRGATSQRPDSYAYLEKSAGRFKLSPTHEDIACCCNPNATRLLPHLLQHQWLNSVVGPTIMLAFYSPGHREFFMREHGHFSIKSFTNYPFGNSVSLSIKSSPGVIYTLMLRRPSWVSYMHVTVEMAHNHKISERGGFICIEGLGQYTFVRIQFENKVRAVPYPDGRVSIHYGPLQFVRTIESQLHPTKDYTVEGFHDYDVRPVDVDSAYSTLVLDAARDNYGLNPTWHRVGNASVDTVSHSGADHPTFWKPWQDIPLTLDVDGVSLVPMGSTILRQAAFPLKNAMEQSSP